MKEVKEMTMTYNELRDEVLRLGLTVENNKKETLIAALEAHLNSVEGKKGRPVDPNSVRQKMLAERVARQASGDSGRKGRPIDPNSKRQLELAGRNKFVTDEEGNVVLDEAGNPIALERRGRPIDPNSKAAQARAAKEALIASGVVIKRGRPKSKTDDAKGTVANKRFKIVITNKATGEKTNYNKSFASEKAAIREMKETGVEMGSFGLEEFTAAQD